MSSCVFGFPIDDDTSEFNSVFMLQFLQRVASTMERKAFSCHFLCEPVKIRQVYWCQTNKETLISRSGEALK